MAQQNIDFGTFPDDPSADAIRTAFNKVQNNFDQLFGANANTTVTSINRTPGAGITVNFPTGNVVVSANLACLQVSTSSLKMGRGSNAGSNALITQSSQTLVIDINPTYVYSNYFADVNNGLSIFNGNLSINANYQANLTSFGNLTSLNVDGRANFTGSNTYIASVSNLHIPGGGAGYTIVTDGAGNLSWSAVTAGNGVAGGNATEVQFQGSGGNLGKFSGNLGFNFTIANGLLQTPLLTVAGNAIAANFIGKLANGNSNITITGNSNITVTANSNSTMLITDTGANITGTANISGNANVGNIGADQGIFTTSANIPLIQNGNSNITIGANTTVSIFVAGNATPTISATLTGANISGIANVSSDIVSGGNISTTGSNGTVQANNFNITGAATGNSNVSTVTGNLGIRAIASTYTDNVVVGGATIANAAIHAIDQPTLAAANAVVTFTNASTLYIANAPAPGTNATLTNPWALNIANGNTYLGGAYNYIAGNLTVAGTTTYYNVTSFAVQDPIISLGGGANGNALTTNDGKDRGTALQYYTSAPVTAFMGWDNSNSEFSFGSNVSITSEVVTFTNLGNARGLTWLGNVDGTYANFTGNIYTTGNANLGNTATANYFTGTLTTANQPNITNVGTLLNTVLGSANSLTGGNLVSATYLTGTLTTAAQPNITSVNTSFSNLTFASNGNITMSGNASQLAGANLVSANFLIGTGITASGAASGNANIATIAGNLGIRALAATYTDTQATIASGNAAIHVIAQPTITGGTNAKAYTNLSTFYIANSPANSTNATFTSSYALFVNAGNSYFGGLISAGANVTAPIFTSNITTGTAPFAVTSTTRVNNLNVAYANVSDFGVVTTQNTGTYYPVFVNGSTTANYALGSNTLISANLANGALIATTFVGNITGNIGGILANGTSNVSIPAVNGNVNITAVGNTTLVVTGTGLTIAANSNITMSGASSQLSGSNLVSATYLVANSHTASGAVTGNLSIGNAIILNTTGINGNLGIKALGNTYTDNTVAASGTIANLAIHAFAQPTIAASNLTVTVSNAATFFVGGAPANSTNITTLTNTYSIWVANGTSRFDGLISAAANVTAPIFTSNITTGTAPFVVTSTTPVANLSVATAGSATNAAAVQTNTSTTNTIYLAGVTSSSNGNSALNIVTGITANFNANTIAATTFNGNISNASSVIANAANGTVFANNHTASGNATGNANVSAVTGNLGIRALFSTYTDNSAIASATIANAAIHAFAAPNLAAANTAVTFTNAATMYIGGAPVANTNATITNPYSLFVAAGNSYFGGNILVNGNVTASQITSNIAVGTAPFVVTSTTQVANLNVATAGSAGTVTTNAQPNINSVGTLTSLTVSGNINSTGNINANYIVGNDAYGGLTVVGTIGAAGDAQQGGSIGIQGGNGNSSGVTIGGLVTISGGTASANGLGGYVYLVGGAGGGTGASITANGGASNSSFSGGNLSLTGGAGRGTNTNGGIITITGGIGTGTGTPGNVAIRVAAAIASGSANQTAANVVVVSSTGITLAANSNITMSGASSQITGANLVSASSFTSGIATGTAPLTVTSTTRVANLNVAYANVSDYGAIAAQTTGTYYPVMISAGTSGNYALAVGPTGISYNLATNTVTATTFAGNLSGNVTATGTVQAANITATAYITRAVTTSISANGTGPSGNTQANATALTTEINIVSAVSVGTGVRLPAAVAGTVVYITNATANSLVVYPQTGAAINNQAANVGFTQGANATLQFMAPTTTQWYTIGATYA